MHNRGIASSIYVEKAGKYQRGIAGKRLDLPEAYHRESWELIKKIVNDLSSAAIAKFR